LHNARFRIALIKNALTRSLDDAALEEMPVVPTDRVQQTDDAPTRPVLDLIAQALQGRPELLESDADLDSRQISRKAARNALLPSLSLVGFYGGTGLAGELNPVFQGENSSVVPTDLGGAMRNAFNNSSPDYYVGLNLNIPFRNRVAKADQYRSELEYRQSELRVQQRLAVTALTNDPALLSRMLGSLQEAAPRPRGALYFSCVARGEHMFGSRGAELGLIQRSLGEVPLVGFFCNGEICHDRLYGYTGVLTLFH